jgi:hypothetical protein
MISGCVCVCMYEHVYVLHVCAQWKPPSKQPPTQSTACWTSTRGAKWPRRGASGASWCCSRRRMCLPPRSCPATTGTRLRSPQVRACVCAVCSVHVNFRDAHCTLYVLRSLTTLHYTALYLTTLHRCRPHGPSTHAASQAGLVVARPPPLLALRHVHEQVNIDSVVCIVSECI